MLGSVQDVSETNRGASESGNRLTEQWSQIQDMLGQIRLEMEELQTSKDFWETQALASSQEIQILVSDVKSSASKYKKLERTEELKMQLKRRQTRPCMRDWRPLKKF